MAADLAYGLFLVFDTFSFWETPKFVFVCSSDTSGSSALRMYIAI